MKKIILLLQLTAISGIISAATLKMNLSEAVKNKSVTAEGVNFEGKYIGKTTKLRVTNNTKSAIQIKVDPGIILKPDNDEYQPMVLVGEEFVMVTPGGHGEVDVQTFCGDAPRHCPEKNLHYTFFGVGSDTLVKVLQFLKKNAVIDYMGQDAVWVITNNQSIGGIYSSERQELSTRLRDILCTVTGRPRPEYYKEMAETPQVPDQPAYVPKTMKIIANFEIILEAPKVLTLGVFNDSGVMVQKIFEDQTFGKSGHRFGVEFEAEGALKGKYYIRLKEGEMVLKEQMVSVD